MRTNVWTRLCLRWSKLVFQNHYAYITPKVRAMRLLEEALELAQAEDVTDKESTIILNQVYGKDKGDPRKELGGVLVCVAAYAGIKQYDLDNVFFDEFERIMSPEIMERVRTRNLEGDKIGLQK